MIQSTINYNLKHFKNNIFCIILLQLFYSFFKSLTGKEVVVELKNDLR